MFELCVTLFVVSLLYVNVQIDFHFFKSMRLMKITDFFRTDWRVGEEVGCTNYTLDNKTDIEKSELVAEVTNK